MSYREKLTRDQIAERVAQDIPTVLMNLGIGLPTKISNYLPSQTEDRILTL